MILPCSFLLRFDTIVCNKGLNIDITNINTKNIAIEIGDNRSFIIASAINVTPVANNTYLRDFLSPYLFDTLGVK